MSYQTQGTKEWHAFRRTHITATDAPIIMGVSPWKNAETLLEEKLGGLCAPKNAYMQHGIDNEPKARAQLEIMLGVDLYPAVIISKDEPWMMASLDALSWDMSIAGEIKCPGKTSHAKSKKAVPTFYYPQLQHQMFVTGLTEIHYLSYYVVDDTSVPDMVYHVVKRDDIFIKEMLIAERQFFQVLQQHQSMS